MPRLLGCVQSFLSPSVPVFSVAFVVLVAMNSMGLFTYLVSLGFLAFKFVSSFPFFYMMQTSGSLSKSDDFSIHRSISKIFFLHFPFFVLPDFESVFLLL